MNSITRRTLFFLFFLSGFSALVYQMVWTRLAFAAFGIIAPVLSVVLSIFMAGLALGALVGGSTIGWLQKRTKWSPLFFYAATEAMIGIGAFAVPNLFHASKTLLLSTGEMDSVRYLLFSAVALALSILPWCLCMGATLPFMMAYIRAEARRSEDSFSFLYTANVLGAMTGTAVTALVLIEKLGFRNTLFVAGCGNFVIALISCILGSRQKRRRADSLGEATVSIASIANQRKLSPRLIELILFSTGFCSMAMEVVWVRTFMPVLYTEVYSFALILFTYLGATLVGSSLYRRDLARNRTRSIATLAAVLAGSAFLPIMLSDLRLFDVHGLATSYGGIACILMASIFPICAALGYLTPSLIDQSGLGAPARAGKAYAVNVVGCILGPLAASYILLPRLGERYSLILLAVPFVLFYVTARSALATTYRVLVDLGASAFAVWSCFFTVDFARFVSSHVPAVVHRDYAASVVAAGDERRKHLFVNGVGMTAMVPATKFMIHLPVMLHGSRPESALIICFGMGTTFRSALSWDLKTTAVELVPGVRDSFTFYHADANEVLHNPNGRIVIDDGRRYLERTREKYDVIVIDPPPPISAAGSSLLYSEEFYEAAKRALKPNAILQAWVPPQDARSEQAAIRSVANSFPYVRCYRSPHNVGTHILASMAPIATPVPETLAAGMPVLARSDLLEWSTTSDLSAYIEEILSAPIPLEQVLNPDTRVRITDDRPFNEYFLLRNLGL